MPNVPERGSTQPPDATQSRGPVEPDRKEAGASRERGVRTSSSMILSVLGCAALCGIGAYLLATKQAPVFGAALIGWGVSQIPGMVFGIAGGLICVGAGGYFLYQNGSGGLLYGGIIMVLGIFILADRVRKRA